MNHDFHSFLKAEQLLDTMPFGCIVWTVEGRGLYYNDTIAQLFDLQEDDNFFENFDRLSPEFQPNGRRSSELAKEYIAGTDAQKTSVIEWIHQKLNGEPIPTEITLVRSNQDGKPVVIAFVRDIRAIKRIEQERDHERLRLLNILNSSPVCFALLDGDTVRFVTPFMGNFLGVNVGDSFNSFIANEDSIEKLQKDRNDDGIVKWHPVTIRTRSGGIKEMLANMFFIEAPETAETIVWLIDVTQIRKTENELRDARNAAEASTRAKSEFLANMSHEIRTPMNAILGMTHLALCTKLTSQQTGYIEAAEQSAKLLLRIINDILDFSKIEAGRMVMEYREFWLHEVIDNLESTVAEALARKDLTLSVVLADELPETMMGDSVRFRQVILNLLSNAIKFTEKGTIRLQVDIAEQDALSILLRCSVNDSGIGMTQKQVKALFKPFSQADSSTTRQYGGTGLGLVISKRIIEMMKGEIYCESALGQGTTFVFTVRFGIPLEGEIVAMDETAEVRTNALLIGDQHDTLTIIRHYLELLKCQVVSRCGSLPAVNQFIESGQIKNVDFIIIDFAELRHNSVQIYQMLQEHFVNPIPLFVFVNHPELEQTLHELNITKTAQVVQKPIAASDLFNVLVMITSQKKERQKAVLKNQIQETRQREKRMTDSDVIVPPSIRGSKILLAEDNKINQMVATELLKMEGFVVSVADNGRIALEMLEMEPFDLVLMDIQMPELDGLQATKIIRSDPRYRNLPVLAMTAHAMAGDRELSIEAGMNDHITKPIDPKTLYKTITKWIKK